MRVILEWFLISSFFKTFDFLPFVKVVMHILLTPHRIPFLITAQNKKMVPKTRIKKPQLDLSVSMEYKNRMK